MNKNSWFVAIVLTVSAILMTIGIVRKVHSLKTVRDQVIAVIPKGAANMWWEVVHKGAEKAAAECWPLLARQKVIWCTSDLTAFALVDAIRRHGLEPGRDIMVIGYDHLAAVAPGCPDYLATIDPGWERCGTALARKILKFIISPEEERRSVTLHARFVPGRTFPFSIEDEVN